MADILLAVTRGVGRKLILKAQMGKLHRTNAVAKTIFGEYWIVKNVDGIHGAIMPAPKQTAARALNLPPGVKPRRLTIENKCNYFGYSLSITKAVTLKGGRRMAANSRFAVAIHALGMLAFGDELNVTSEDIARSVRTNPVVVRRLLAQLTRQGLVAVKLGAGGGARLTRPPERVTLAEIYLALGEGPLFQVPHLDETHECAIGRSVGPVLSGVLLKAEKSLLTELQSVTLSDVIGKVVRRMKRQGCAPDAHAAASRTRKRNDG